MHDERDDAWTRYLTWRWADAELGVELDLGDAGLAAEQFTGAWEDRLTRALAAMAALEAGALANPDEGRQVGHYWLRAPSLAPDPAITAAIERSWEAIEAVAGPFRAGELTGSNGQVLDRVILVGIGGSALGPQLVADALAPAGARLTVLDNTDPIGMRRALAEHGPLAQSLALVVSKSGSTVETRNGMVELTAAFAGAGLSFEEHAVAITGPESQLDLRARGEGGGAPWRARLPLWDWVGGRTSVCSPVGLLPAALLGIDWRGLLAGAARMDAATRAGALRENPAITLARLWFSETGGRGERAMVVLPYRDRLVLLSRYLQQLVMESLGKRLDRAGAEVWQGLAVYGNKGATDQHAYVQQLRDGRHDFFVTFVRALDDGPASGVFVEPGVTAGDCLDGFYQGTRAALTERGRRTASLVLERLDAPALGALIALFERTVGLYAELIDVNAYHQPGVEAGKRAARSVLELQRRVLATLDAAPKTARELATILSADTHAVWQVLRRLPRARADVRVDGVEPATARFSRVLAEG